MVEQLGEARLEIGASVVADAIDHLLITKDAKIFESDSAGHRMARIGEAVHPFAALLEQQRGDAIMDRDASHGQIAGRQALGEGDEIRFDSELVRSKPFAGPSKAAHHLVDHQ